MDIVSIINAERAKGSILDVMKAVQAQEGYLSDDAICQIASAYDRSPAQVYETATFYSMLRVKKPTMHVIEICGSTCCDAGGVGLLIDEIRNELGIGIGQASSDGKWFLRRCECLGRCDTAPNMVIDGVLYTDVSASTVREIIRKADN